MKRLPKRSRQRALQRLEILTATLVVMLILVCGTLVVIPIVSPAAGAATADIIRSVVGPQPVAHMESVSAWMKDTLYRAVSLVIAVRPAISWSGGMGPAPRPLTGTPEQRATVTSQPTTPSGSAGAEPAPVPTIAIGATSLPPVDVVTAFPQIGWQAYGPQPVDGPLMASTLIMVDPQRSYAGVALVRMDLTQLQLHLMAGFIEPAHPSGISQRIPDLGMVPAVDQRRLIAAFNGGFKAVHGHFGMMLDGLTLLSPIDGMGTIAIYDGGSVGMGVWGSGIKATSDMIAFRQNCPPLIQNGQLNPALATNAARAWGITNNTDVTWRTGLGLTQDGRYLIYAVGNGTDARFLGMALQEAGAYNAMQLDINQYYAHFVTYGSVVNTTGSGDRLQAQRLLDQMTDVSNLYLTPYARDFFYLTLRP